jgi:ABC-type uncharacterized transport system ATPase subunit
VAGIEDAPAVTAVAARLQGIGRRFGSVVALAGADLELRAGEVHGVLGANGAGKSTLLNILGGMLRPDAGGIEIDGRRVELSSPKDAWALGIGLVHQHFTLVPSLSVTENLALGRRGAGSALSDLREEATALMARTALRVPLGRRVETLGVGDRQRIEILKALLRDPRVLVLDEPTAVLTPDEIDGLFDLLRELADEGRAVALVAHKVDEVLGVAHRVTVLRDGRTVLSVPRAQGSVQDLVRAMVGDEEVDRIAVGLGGEPDGREGGGTADEATRGTGPHRDAPLVAELRGVSVHDDAGPRLADVDLGVRPGEVVGVAGVEGNGQRELALVLAARLAPSTGSVRTPETVGFISQDRSNEGLIADFDLTENVALAFHRKAGFTRGPWVRWHALRSAAEEVRTRYRVDAPSVATRARALSGGNQQRVIVGRELGMATELLVAENPTRGLDISASAFVHDELRRLSSMDVAVVLLSTDLDEILALSHRIFTIARGRLTEVPPHRRSREGVGAAMLGGIAGDD